MVDNGLFMLTLATAVGAGLSGGILFIFSNTIMRSLGQQPPPAGIATMQTINRVILNPLFFLVFVGTGVGALALGISLLWRWSDSHTLPLLVGSLLYLFGVLGVTAVRNVPMNEALDRLPPDSSAAAELWQTYLTRWTAWNHVRTLAAGLSTVMLILSLIG